MFNTTMYDNESTQTSPTWHLTCMERYHQSIYMYKYIFTQYFANLRSDISNVDLLYVLTYMTVCQILILLSNTAM